MDEGEGQWGEWRREGGRRETVGRGDLFVLAVGRKTDDHVVQGRDSSVSSLELFSCAFSGEKEGAEERGG